MENWRANPMHEWDGSFKVSASWKEENGKVRLILACDTVTYVAFQHFLSGVEKAWRNKRVLLDPGAEGPSSIAERVRQLGPFNYVSVMLDYDDFNSQHTTRAMQIVLEEAGTATGYDAALLRRLVGSLEREDLYAAGEYLGRVTGTLMSGHRGTTFFNSVLNAAYMIAADPGKWASGAYSSLHTGDDIVAVFTNYTDVVSLLSSMRAAGCRLNALKQSIGSRTREFLRMAIKPDYAVGYALRSVASLVSGNWVTPGQLGPASLLTSVVTSARSLINRCGHDLPAMMLVQSVRHRTGYGARAISDVLLGRAGLGDGPVFDRCGRAHLRRYDVVYDKGCAYDVAGTDVETEPSHATGAYLAKHVSEIERIGLELSGGSVFYPMLEASYAKSLSSQGKAVPLNTSKLRQGRETLVRGCEFDTCVRGRPDRPGMLSQYPVLQMLKDRLSVRQVGALLRQLGKRLWPDVMLQAWGSVSRPVLITGALPYGEAASLSRKTEASVIRVTKPVYM